MELKIQQLNDLQKCFIKSFDSLQSLYSRYSLDQSDIEIKMDGDNVLEVTMPHPVQSEYNIIVFIDEEIIIFFNRFHSHHDNFADERSFEEVVESALREIEIILSSKHQITIFSKGQKIYKETWQIISPTGEREIMQRCYHSWIRPFFGVQKEVVEITFWHSMQIIEDQEKNLVIIDGLEINGFIDDTPCAVCGQPQVFYEEYDAFFCPRCNKWIDSKCGDSTYSYCSKRPDTPLPLKK